MENIRTTYMPIGQAVRTNYKSTKIKKFIKRNRISLIIVSVSISLLLIYSVLLINFINLVKIMY